MWVTLECESREGEKMKGMIHLKSRVTVAILAFAMVIAMLPVLGEKAYAVTSAPYLSLIAVDDNGNSLTDTSLELGDEVTYQLVATGDLNSIPVGMISGSLDYSEDTFEPVVNSDFVPAAGWTVYWDAETNKFSIQTATDVPFATNDVICSIRMRVKRAVDGNASIAIKGSLTDNAQLIEIHQHNNGSEAVLFADNVTSSLTNTQVEGTRVFEMEVPQTLTFYTNAPARDKEIKVPISIKSGSLYAGFRIAFTYNSGLLTYEGYELSQTAGAYVQMITQSDPIPSSNLITRNIALVSSRDINQPGEFIYLKFKTASGVASGVGGANLTITLYEAVNQSRAPMTYTLTSGTNSQSGTTTLAQTLNQNIPITFTTRQVLRGDVNYDGKINLVDALMVMQYYNGIRELSQEEKQNEVGSEYERADVNQSGTVTLVDALLILKYYNGEISTFPIV